MHLAIVTPSYGQTKVNRNSGPNIGREDGLCYPAGKANVRERRVGGFTAGVLGNERRYCEIA